MRNSYQDAINLLTSSQKFKVNLGLERMSKILELLGNPQDKLKCIHVAGTNGKGSVCAIISTILEEAGYKTGLYTSPHIFDYTERIKINSKDITKIDFANYLFDSKNKKVPIYVIVFYVIVNLILGFYSYKGLLDLIPVACALIYCATVCTKKESNISIR